MSETTKSADCPIGIFISITQTYGRDTTEFEKLAFAHLLIGAKMRAAEGGAERETTNSPAEIGAGCAGRKIDPAWLFVLPFMLVTAVGLLCALADEPWLGFSCYALFSALCGFGLVSGRLVAVRGGGVE